MCGCWKAAIHCQVMLYDSAGCLMPDTNIGWPATATCSGCIWQKGKCVARHATTEWQTLAEMKTMQHWWCYYHFDEVRTKSSDYKTLEGTNGSQWHWCHLSIVQGCPWIGSTYLTKKRVDLPHCCCIALCEHVTVWSSQLQACIRRGVSPVLPMYWMLWHWAQSIRLYHVTCSCPSGCSKTGGKPSNSLPGHPLRIGAD